MDSALPPAGGATRPENPRMTTHYWTPAEDAILIDIRGMAIPQYQRNALYAQRLPNRTMAGIHNRVKCLDLPRRPTRNAHRWTETDREILRREAPSKDAGEIAVLLGRSSSSVQNEMRRLNIPRRKYQHIVATPEIDQAIREAYGSARRGICRRIADQLGIEVGWIKARARKLGLTRSTGDYWTPQEDRILEEAMQAGGARFVMNQLKKAGFVRSTSAIENRVHQLGLGWSAARDIYNAADLALAMGVCSKTVVKWIRQGLLKGHLENPSGLSSCEEAGRWMIWHGDARRFLIDNPNAYRLNTVDRHWFISTLAKDLAVKIQDQCGVRAVAASGFEEATCHC